MRAQRFATVALLLAAITPVAMAQNQLTNPGFEAGSLAGWSVGGPRGGTVFASTAGVPIPGGDAIFGPGTSRVQTGSYAASGTVRGNCCAAAVEPFTLSQTLSLVPGAMYTVGFSIAHAGTQSVIGMDPGDAAMQIFVGSLGLLAPSFVNADPGDWLTFSSSFTAAGGPTTVTFQIVGSGTAYAPVSVDDFFVGGPSATVPEPATFALLGAGLVVTGVVVRRRRA